MKLCYRLRALVSLYVISTCLLIACYATKQGKKHKDSSDEIDVFTHVSEATEYPISVTFRHTKLFNNNRDYFVPLVRECVEKSSLAEILRIESMW